jgi:cAMP phosphodiesterase
VYSDKKKKKYQLDILIEILKKIIIRFLVWPVFLSKSGKNEASTAFLMKGATFIGVSGLVRLM